MIVQDFITGYVKGTLGKKTKNGRWSIINWGLMDVLVYTPEYEEWQYRNQEKPGEERVAYKLLDGSVLSNANQLKYVGKFRDDDDQAQEQIWLEGAGAIPLPFTLFEETNTDVRDFSWIVKPVPETITVMINQHGVPTPTPRHFTGACVFAIDKDTYLFDVDRKELIDNKIFNPFMTKLPRMVASIKGAYDMLMPEKVRKAISEGTEVLRQGEFFFIKHSDNFPVTVTLTKAEKNILKFPPSRFGFGIPPIKHWRDREVSRESTVARDDCYPYQNDKSLDTPEKKEFQKAALHYKRVLDKYQELIAQPGVLGKSATGSHAVEKYIKSGETVFVSGTVKQSRRQHGDLVLTGWYEVVANTGTISWTIRGDID